MLIFVFDTNEQSNKFMDLYDNYAHYIKYTVKRYIKDSFIEEDLFQEILIILASHIDEIHIENKRKARNYVITVSKNYSLNYLSKQKNKHEYLSEEIVETESFTDDIKSLPLDYLLRKETYQELYDALDKLDDKYRIVLELKYFNNLDDAAISEMLGIKKKTVEMHIYRGKKMLQKILRENHMH